MNLKCRHISCWQVLARSPTPLRPNMHCLGTWNSLPPRAWLAPTPLGVVLLCSAKGTTHWHVPLQQMLDSAHDADRRPLGNQDQHHPRPAREKQAWHPPPPGAKGAPYTKAWQGSARRERVRALILARSSQSLHPTSSFQSKSGSLLLRCVMCRVWHDLCFGLCRYARSPRVHGHASAL